MGLPKHSHLWTLMRFCGDTLRASLHHWMSGLCAGEGDGGGYKSKIKRMASSLGISPVMIKSMTGFRMFRRRIRLLLRTEEW